MKFTELGRARGQSNAVRFLGHDTSSHAEPQLVYVVNGIGRLAVEGRTVILHAHHSAWLPPHVPHALSLSDDGMAIGPLLGPTAVPPLARVRVFGPVKALSDLITVLLCAAPETEEEKAPFRHALGELLHTLTREQFPLVYPQHPVAYAVAAEAARFDGTLADLAGRHFTSVRHLQRLFADETGLTFARWRTRARLNIAIVALRAGETLRSAMHESRFTTRQGLLKAMSRECDVPLARLVDEGPLAALERGAA